MSNSTAESTIELNSTNTFPSLAPGVYIVGAGPGDPELLTVKAQKLLMQGDVILYADSLVPRQILKLCRPEAEIIHTANKTLEDILPVMVERVRSHKSVIRLQSGDPSLYSAIHEQIQALAAAEIPFEVIPGISAFQAAAAKLNVELTVPGLVQTIILCRISGRTQVPAREELSSLAAHQASLCLYLAARHVESAQSQLLEHYQPETPVAICFRLGWEDEKICVTTLDKMAETTHKEQLIRTTLYVISPALGEVTARSRLYHPEHTHLFRPKTKGNAMTQPEIFDTIELLVDLPEFNLRAGNQGAIVECYEDGKYEVEFSDRDGETLALATLSSIQFIIIWKAKTKSWLSVSE